MKGVVAVYHGRPDRYRDVYWNERYMLDINGHVVTVRKANINITYASVESFFDDWIVTGYR